MLDATKSFSMVLTDPKDVEGLPESLLQLTAESAAADNNANLERARLILLTCLPLQYTKLLILIFSYSSQVELIYLANNILRKI